jgi:1,4-dihydroxy-2-naphthoyl-CoA synthase
MSHDTLAVEREGGVARVWLARPERLNALNARALEEIAAVFTELRTAFDVQAMDGDLLTLASEEDPTRFVWPGKRET